VNAELPGAIAPLHEAGDSALRSEERRRETLEKQIKNILILQPLFALEADKARLVERPEGLDLLYLGLSLLDFLTEQMGFGEGAPHEETYRFLEQRCQAMVPDMPAETARDLARKLVTRLTNADARGGRKRFECTYFSPKVGYLSQYAFSLIQTKESSDGQLIFFLTEEGLAAALSMLDQDFSELHADDLLIQRAIERGRYFDAKRAAENKRRESIRYASKLRSFIEKMRRSASAVDWVGQVLPHLDLSRDHLEEGHDQESLLLSAVSDRIETVSGEQQEHLLHLRDCLRETAHRNLDLHEIVRTANERFRAQHLNTLAVPVSAFTRNVETELLVPLLCSTSESLSDCGDRLVAALHAAAAPTLFDPCLLVEGIETDSQNEALDDNAALSDEAGERTELTGIIDRFPDAMRETAREFLFESLRGRQDLSLDVLLAQSQHAGHSPLAQLCLLYEALFAFNQSDAKAPFNYNVVRKGSFEAPFALGDNLLFASLPDDH